MKRLSHLWCEMKTVYWEKAVTYMERDESRIVGKGCHIYVMNECRRVGNGCHINVMK